jgi:hypothetical protein
VLKTWFREMFGAELSQSSPADENDPGLPPAPRGRRAAAPAGAAPAAAKPAKVVHACRARHPRRGTNGCRELRMSDKAMRYFFAFVARYSEVNDAESLPVARTWCERIGAAELPGLMPVADAAPAAPAAEDDADDGGYGPYGGYGHDALFEEPAAPAGAEPAPRDAEADLTAFVDREKKRAPVQARQAEVDREERHWNAVLAEYVQDSYTPGVSAEAYVTRLLAPGMKVRTKRSMRAAVQAYKDKIDRLGVTQ